MVFTETRVKGVFLIEPERHDDDRGFFARTWSAREFCDRGLDASIAQCSVSYNHQRGTVRGMHYQAPPHDETKLVRCTRGAIFDVALDLRRDSETFGQWVGEELTAHNHRMLYIPVGCAHGFQTLADGSEVFYQISQVYEPAAARGVRWDDPAFDIRWPEPVRVIAERDRTYPDFRC